MPEKIEFIGYNISPQFLRTDKSVRVTIDVSKDQLEQIKDITSLKLTDGVYTIIIESNIDEKYRQAIEE